MNLLSDRAGVSGRRQGSAWLAACLLLAAVAGCGAPPVRPENELFREGSLAFEEESYASAIESYKKMLEEYPFSDKAEIASLNIAYAYYLTGQYTRAIESFNDFERLYPVSRLLPFVSYTIGMCWLDQAKSRDRDSSTTEVALRQFERVTEEFRGTLYSDLAAFRARQSREILGAHEIFVGDYYRDRKRLEAAGARYRYVIDTYPTTEAATRASSRLQELASNDSRSSATVSPDTPIESR